VPPPHSPDLSYGDDEGDRDGRLREVEERLSQRAQAAAEAEDLREAEFRRKEDERNRLFLEHEQRRDDESRQRRDQVLQEPPPPAQPGEPELSAEAAEARTRTEDEREARIRALEAELATVKAELDNERQQRVTEEAETRERERQETLDRDEAVRNQLGDITNLIQDQRDVCARKKELMDERWEEKQVRREDKDSKLAELRDMVTKIIQDREEDRLKAEEDRVAAEARPGLSPSKLASAKNSPPEIGIEKVLDELQRQNAEQREYLNSLSESNY